MEIHHDTFQEKPLLPLGRYRHYKGGEYEVIALACDEQTHEWRVIYMALYDTEGAPNIWDRKYDVFTEEVDVDGVRVPRFEKID